MNDIKLAVDFGEPQDIDLQTKNQLLSDYQS